MHEDNWDDLGTGDLIMLADGVDCARFSDQLALKLRSLIEHGELRPVGNTLRHGNRNRWVDKTAHLIPHLAIGLIRRYLC